MTWRAARRFSILAILLFYDSARSRVSAHPQSSTTAGRGTRRYSPNAVASGARGIASTDVRLLSVDSIFGQ